MKELFFPEDKFSEKSNRMKVPLGSSESSGFFSGSRVNQQQRFPGGRVHFNFYTHRSARFEEVMSHQCFNLAVGNQKLFEMSQFYKLHCSCSLLA